jgi:pyruvate formate lyase activating enzyme
VFTGNTHDPDGQSTYCHACQAVLIGRDWYQLTQWNLAADGRCGSCGTPCPGVFEGPPGLWGRQRRRIMVEAMSSNRC